MAKVRVKRDAAQDKLLGKEVLAYLNYGEGATHDKPVWALIGGQTTADYDMSADSIDATNKTSDGWGETYAGNKSTELDLEGVICKSDEAYEQLQEAFMAGEAVDICRFRGDGRAERNWYSITELSDETPHDDTSTFKLTLNGLGEPTFYKSCKTVDDVGPATEIKKDSATTGTTPSPKV